MIGFQLFNPILFYMFLIDLQKKKEHDYQNLENFNIIFKNC